MVDIAILNWLHSHTIPGSIPVLQFISYTTTLISISLVVIVLIIAIARKSKSFLKKFSTLAVVLIFVLIASQGLKAIIFRERPFVTYPYIEKLSEAGSSSFPSGHTLEAFAIAASISLLFFRKKVIIPIYTWAMLVAYSRMALGVHYPSDVLAGIIIGTFIGWIVPWGFRRIFPSDNTHIQDVI
jgi:membrane-associated phospholipid phosphatase